MKYAWTTMALLAALGAAAPAQAYTELAQRLPEVGFGVVEDLADADADGDVDFLAREGIGMRVHLNDGAGLFTPGPVIAFPPGDGYGVKRTRFADVTGDDLADILLLRTATPDSAIVLYEGQGAGTFAAPVIVPISGNPLDIALGDQFGDGVLDVALLTTPQPWARWLSWDGATLVKSPRVAVDVGLSPGIATHDWDGDGVLDILVGASFGEDVRVVLTVGGVPTLGPLVTLRGPVGNGRNLVAGDLEGDGDVDVLGYSYDFGEGASFWVIENQGPGLHVVGPRQSFTGAGGVFIATEVFLGDWDDDGDLDALNNHELLNLFENDGANGFALRANVVTGYDDVGGGPADLDGDGDLDFAAARAIKWGNATFDGTFDPFLENNSGITGIVARDWEGDGDVDLLDRIGRIAVNDGTGSFTTIAEAWPAPPADFIYDDAATVEDVDGDGRADYVVGFFELVPFGPFTIAEFRVMRLLAGDGLGGFADTGDAAAPLARIPENIRLNRPTVDLDGDGDRDLTVSGGIWTNDGTGFFTESPGLFDPGIPVDAGDVDGDGDLDLLATTGSLSTGSVVLHRNETVGGSPSFSTETLLFQDAQMFASEGARFLDLDEDGDLDAVAGGAGQILGGDQLYVLENIGAGSFVERASLETGSFNGAVVGQQDVDGDGLLDLVAGPFADDPNGNELVVLRRTGGLSFEPRVEFVLDDLLVRFADIDGDGDDDVIGTEFVADVWRFDGPGDGVVRQYGSGGAGTGGAVPVFGASGPVRVGDVAGVHLRRALGGAPAFALLGGVESANATVKPGVVLYAFPWTTLVSLVLPGPPGVAGAGQLDAPILVDPAFAGVSVFLQMIVVDAAATGGLSYTNGLEITFGN